MEQSEIIINCRCGCRMVKGSKDETGFWFAMYNFGTGTFGVLKRLKAACQLIIKGTYFADAVILDSEESQKLKEFILTQEELKKINPKAAEPLDKEFD